MRASARSELNSDFYLSRVQGQEYNLKIRFNNVPRAECERSIARMLTYLLIGLVLVLTGVVGLQFTFLFYIDRMDMERKKYLRQLERRSAELTERLRAAQEQITEKDALIDQFVPVNSVENEAWADVIDEN